MKNRTFGLILVLLVAVGVTVCLWPDEPTAPHDSNEAPAQNISVPEPSDMPKNEIHASSGIPQLSSEKAVDNEIENFGKKDDIRKMFQSDERDNLVLNESTRLNIEKLYALNTPEELESQLQKLSTVLPSAAYRQLVHLVDYFDKYITASKQIYPPDEAPATAENALDQMAGLHSLRVTHFGFDVAAAFFAEEEKLNRQLLEVTAHGGRWDDGNVSM